MNGYCTTEEELAAELALATGFNGQEFDGTPVFVGAGIFTPLQAWKIAKAQGITSFWFSGSSDLYITRQGRGFDMDCWKGIRLTEAISAGQVRI
jgi:hypothetical protein